MLKHCFIKKPLIGILVTVFFSSCQRELSSEHVSVSSGYLSADYNEDCKPVIIAGNYKIGQGLIDSNYIEIEVTVTSPGSYNIFTDTINGYSFKADGIFSTSGLTMVKLRGLGTPVTGDSDHFTIHYDQSICNAIIAVPDTSIKPAVYTFEAASNICADNTVYGSYIEQSTLDTGARVKINVNVITPGTYLIISNALNGYIFSGSGSFTNTGIQTVFLNASGTPINAGTNIFTVTAGNSNCGFSVDVLAPVNVSGNDHYPLTYNSYWTYDDLVNTGDTIKRTVYDSTDINGHIYKRIKEDIIFGGPLVYFIRKSGTDYLEYAAPNKFTTFFQYKNPVNADIPFLKENLLTGAVWESPEYIDTASTGDVITLKYDFTCLDADAAVTINGKAFANVYEIKMLPLVKSAGNDYAYTSEEYLFYYAKGIGMIYLKKTLGGFIQNELQIRNWLVN